MSRPSRYAAPPRRDASLLDALRSGDENAFVELVDTHTPALLRVARLYVRTQASAEEVVQETWLAVLNGLDRFEGRSSVRTWLFAILANVARKHAERDRRSVPLASLEREPAVPADRFFDAAHPRWAGMWSTLVDSWDEVPEAELLGAEARRRLNDALSDLPARYAVVFVLRDVEGWSAGEVCTLLDVSQENQRVLLHRARSRIRAALEEYFERRSA